MQHLRFTADFDAPLQTVWDFYDDVDTLLKITPPQSKVEVKNAPPKIKKGSRFTLIVRQPPIFIPLAWETIITVHDAPTLFIDEQGRGPFAYWHHEHYFESLPNSRTRLTDTLSYLPPLGILGTMANALFIRSQLNAMFAYRHQKTREFLAHNRSARDTAP